jgi:hypothetical protein
MLTVAVACDIADIAAIETARRRGKVSSLSAAFFSGASLACLALCAQALAPQEPS